MDVQYIGENLLAGKFGHAFVILSFVGSLVAFFAYFFSAIKLENKESSWKKLGRIAFWLHALAVIGIVVTLFGIIYFHLYEYFYAWSHASRALPTHYIVSAFWEGQEGSFLLWTFWHIVIGIVLMYSARKWEAPVMSVVALAQVALSSMLLGIYVLDYKVGSSPFILLREAMEAPIFAQANYLSFITDGNGLNPLLQNPWMVIHPPVLFLGFASTIVPFAFALAGLFKRDYSGWITPALPWTLFGAMILGTGVIMGGAWAYESLNFGGYWAWDPVENAALVPWLTLIGALHVMNAYRRTGNSLPTTFILVIATFILILYATFLTRSGVLGDSSVHSFTDLGMSGQLLVFLFIFVLLGVGLLIYHWKKLPKTQKEESTYSREFWLFIGALILSLSAFQVLATTSIPVFNKVFGTNVAPPVDPIGHYNRWQLPMVILILILITIGQLLKYKKSNPAEFYKRLMWPFIAAVALTIGIFIPFQIYTWQYILLIFAAAFAFFGNLEMIRQQWKKIKSSGAAISHIGFALMMLGVLISSARKEIVSINNSGFSYGENFDAKATRENVLLWKNEPLTMNDYRVTYLGDSVVEPNHYYKVFYEKLNKAGDVAYSFMLTPNAQINPKMGLIASPDTKHYLGHDLYTHVTQVIDKTTVKDQPEYGEPKSYTFNIGQNDTIMLAKNLLFLEGLNTNFNAETAAKTAGAEVAVAARLRVRTLDGEKILEPVYAIKNGVEFRYDVTDADLRVTFNKIDPKSGSIELLIAEKNPGPREYVIMKALRFPMINLLWLGTVVLVIGFSMAVMYRYREAKRIESREPA